MKGINIVSLADIADNWFAIKTELIKLLKVEVESGIGSYKEWYIELLNEVEKYPDVIIMQSDITISLSIFEHCDLPYVLDGNHLILPAGDIMNKAMKCLTTSLEEWCTEIEVWD